MMNTMHTLTPQASATAVAVSGNAPQPDPDSVKMFVGQIPKGWNETDMRKLLEEFGHIYYINILRDQVTGESKGCCFVTYYTRKAAMDAAAALHNRRTLPGCQHPIQMKCADSESRKIEDRKLFIGMVTKSYSEEDVRHMFEVYGHVDEVRVLRDAEGHSRGCAFVILSTKFSAENAIKALHHSQIMDGCSSPLVVKFAETAKEKEQKKLQQLTSQFWNGMNALGPQYYHIFQQAAQAMASNNQMSQNVPPPNPAIMQQLMQITQQLNPSGTQGNANPAATLAAAAAMAMAGGGSFGGGLPPQNTTPTPQPPSNQWSPYGAGPGGPPSAPANNQFGNMFSQFGVGGGGGNMSQAAGKQMEGPEGCNLFIYHLPKEFTDHDLAQTFVPFGSVISAKVFVDKVTNTSKGFGFVSYDSPVAAQSAIQAMNGFQIGMKRLKVSVKRSKMDGKPY